MNALEEPYRSRAIPPGSARYWSWQFAAHEARSPLLGLYALAAEWRALTDAAVDMRVAALKLEWWREEIRRLAAGAPLHPITQFIAGMPRAAAADLGRLDAAVEAASLQVSGVPLERAAELERHAAALLGIPLEVAAALCGPLSDPAAVRAGAAALATAEYLARALRDYGREARAGRVLFPVDALLAAGIANDDLAASPPPPPLARYLDGLRAQAAGCFDLAAGALPRADRPLLRHHAVLAVLGGKHLNDGPVPKAGFYFADLHGAWRAARRAAAAR